MTSFKLKEQQQEWLIKIGFGIITMAVCFWLMISPLFRDAAQFRERAMDDQKRLSLSKDIRDLKKRLSRLEAPLATSTDRSLMFGKISDVANKNKMDIQNLTPKTSKAGSYVSLRIQLVGRGGFLALLNFLKAIETLKPPVVGRDLVLSRSRPGGGSRNPGEHAGDLNIGLALESYLKQPRGKKKL